MSGYFVYDIEISPNFASFSFAKLTSDDHHAFVIHEARDDRAALVAFMQNVKGLVGFNNCNYDSPMMRYFLREYDSGAFHESWSTPSEVTAALFAMSQRLISDDFRNDDEIRELRYPRQSAWKDLDLLKMMAFDRMGVGLKQIAVNLRWPRIIDLPFDYDALIPADKIDMVLDYNLNDTGITRCLYDHLQPEIQLRKDIGKLYGVDLTSASDSKIGNVVLEHALAPDKETLAALKKKRTPRSVVRIADCIPPQIEFTSPELMRLREQLEKTVVYHSSGFRYSVKVNYAGNQYQLGIGGLHSADKADIEQADADTIIRDADVNSFYPQIVLNLGIRPEHLDEKFNDVLRQMVEDRLKAKREGDKVRAGALKISVNGAFGKFGFDHYFLYDPQALIRVTVAGQLFLLWLIEMMHEVGIEVISANTDGICAKFKRSQEADYQRICSEWQQKTGFELEFTDYAKLIKKDVNNYTAIKCDGKVKEKGIFAQPEDLKHGFKMPIIQKALHAYFVKGICVEETIRACHDIYEFSTSQKCGGQFISELHLPGGKIETLQKTNRFCIARQGGALVKRHRTTSKETRIYAGEAVTLLNDIHADTPFSDYGVKTEFYIAECQKIIETISPKIQQMALFG